MDGLCVREYDLLSFQPDGDFGYNVGLAIAACAGQYDHGGKK